MTFVKLNQVLIVCASISLMTACTPKSDQNQSTTPASAPTTAGSQAQDTSTSQLTLRSFTATPDDAHDIAQLDGFYEKINALHTEVEADLKNLKQQGNLSTDMAIQRQSDYLKSALNMLKALNLRTEQGRYIQGLLYQHWESQTQHAIQPASTATEPSIRLERDDIDHTDYLSAQQQLKTWKSLQTDTLKGADS